MVGDYYGEILGRLVKEEYERALAGLVEEVGTRDNVYAERRLARVVGNEEMERVRARRPPAPDVKPRRAGMRRPTEAELAASQEEASREEEEHRAAVR